MAFRQTKNLNSKNTDKKFVGQPIFKQIIDFILKAKFESFVHEHHSDRHYKTFDSSKQLETMFLGILSR
ncbi:MAG: DUF4372 domain-containing protein [Bacteroidetes bacterium]|nr:DUF4372 domain-containing protein [Bacteroidota bacterium]